MCHQHNNRTKHMQSFVLFLLIIGFYLSCAVLLGKDGSIPGCVAENGELMVSSCSFYADSTQLQISTHLSMHVLAASAQLPMCC
jgi:hypothetical protein